MYTYHSGGCGSTVKVLITGGEGQDEIFQRLLLFAQQTKGYPTIISDGISKGGEEEDYLVTSPQLPRY